MTWAWHNCSLSLFSTLFFFITIFGTKTFFDLPFFWPKIFLGPTLLSLKFFGQGLFFEKKFLDLFLLKKTAITTPITILMGFYTIKINLVYCVISLKILLSIVDSSDLIPRVQWGSIQVQLAKCPLNTSVRLIPTQYLSFGLSLRKKTGHSPAWEVAKEFEIHFSTENL